MALDLLEISLGDPAVAVEGRKKNVFGSNPALSKDGLHLAEAVVFIGSLPRSFPLQQGVNGVFEEFEVTLEVFLEGLSTPRCLASSFLEGEEDEVALLCLGMKCQFAEAGLYYIFSLLVDRKDDGVVDLPGTISV